MLTTAEFEIVKQALKRKGIDLSVKPNIYSEECVNIDTFKHDIQVKKQAAKQVVDIVSDFYGVRGAE